MSAGSIATGTVIVGASQAGVQLAVSLRDAGYTAPITLVGAETHAPYHRPPLSKKPLAGPDDVASLVLRSESFYHDRGIDLVLGQRIVRAERGAAGGVVETADGSLRPFRDLALTVGARARRLLAPGADLPGVVHLRSVDDAIDLWSRLDRAHHVVVVGAGFVGLEAAAVAAARGHHVTVVEAGERVMARAVSPVMSDFFTAAHRRRGVEVLLGAGVERILGDVHVGVTAVQLSDGRVLPADLVVVGIGVEPRTELAPSLGLVCEGGIVVDEYSRASDGRTVVAGDCALMPNPAPGGIGRRRIESVNNAVEQGKNAAATLMGRAESYRLTPWFWSDQADLKLQMVGDIAADDQLVVRGASSSESFTVLHYRGGMLTGAQCVNRPVDFTAVRAALSRGLTVPEAGVEDPAVPLKTLVREKALGSRL